MNISDPLEKEIAGALNNAGISFQHESDGKIALDFLLCNGIFIECKAFHSDRSAEQLKKGENVILVQGKKANKFLAYLIGKSIERR